MGEIAEWYIEQAENRMLEGLHEDDEFVPLHQYIKEREIRLERQVKQAEERLLLRLRSGKM